MAKEKAKENVAKEISMPETSSKDPYEQGKQAAADNIPAAGNPYDTGSDRHSKWAAGHASVASAIEAGEAEGN